MVQAVDGRLLGPKPPVGVGFMALIKELDDRGSYDPEHGVVMTPQGPRPLAGRRQYVDAKELVSMFVDAMEERFGPKLCARCAESVE